MKKWHSLRELKVDINKLGWVFLLNNQFFHSLKKRAWEQYRVSASDWLLWTHPNDTSAEKMSDDAKRVKIN